MEIRVYSPELMLLGIIDDASSLVWTRRYWQVGEMQMVLPITPDNVRLTARGNLVTYAGAGDAAVIEDREITDSSGDSSMTVCGRFLASYMDRRLIRPMFSFSGRVEVAMRTILSNAYPIPLVQLGTLKGFADTVSFQATYKELLKYETKLAKCAGLGYHFVPDFTGKTITFEVYRGLDRSVSQSDRARVIFADEYCNLEGATFRENDQLEKNVIYIGGAGEGADRTVVSYGDATGLARREVFVDARDIQRDSDTTEQEYLEKLYQRGREKSADSVASVSMEYETLATANFTYRKDYDLGDIVTLRKDAWGVAEDLRITEIQEVYEQGLTRLVPTLGQALETNIDWSDT